jgi:ArsR family transcriptional regulator, cadmium/lead-responsive transcriptional repressor
MLDVSSGSMAIAVQQDPKLGLKAKLFRGLADPSRLAILEILRAGERTVSDVVEATGLSQPNASSHLACLRDCGLVLSRQDGRFVYYRLADGRVEDLLRQAEGILAGVADRVYACTRYES